MLINLAVLTHDECTVLVNYCHTSLISIVLLEYGVSNINSRLSFNVVNATIESTIVIIVSVRLGYKRPRVN